LGVHYPTDVIAGALLGYGMTKVVSLYFPLSLAPGIISVEENKKMG
jgi:membrane-associated phospholipid phosphatase